MNISERYDGVRLVVTTVKESKLLGKLLIIHAALGTLYLRSRQDCYVPSARHIISVTWLIHIFCNNNNNVLVQIFIIVCLVGKADKLSQPLDFTLD